MISHEDADPFTLTELRSHMRCTYVRLNIYIYIYGYEQSEEISKFFVKHLNKIETCPANYTRRRPTGHDIIAMIGLCDTIIIR